MVLRNLEMPGIPKIASGKVREIFDVGECLLLVTTDRISAFDCILPDLIPHKGEVLNSLSAFWFERFTAVQNHLVSTAPRDFPEMLQPYEEALTGRSMLVRKAAPLPVECVVRGYLAGSGWKEYAATGAVCGIALPTGLREGDRLSAPLFTPSTKAQTGHDKNISYAECAQLLGSEIAEQVRDISLQLYREGERDAAEKGIIVADTKFEFGMFASELILIDECLTPDSSRFWPAAQYAVGGSPPSFDKQFVRDYLESLSWNKTPPAPALPHEIIERTSAKYLEAFQRLTGRKLAGAA